jgi:hypothetical protein
LEKALAIQRQEGPEHPLVGKSYNNIGTAYAAKGDKPKAYTY